MDSSPALSSTLDMEPRRKEGRKETFFYENGSFCAKLVAPDFERWAMETVAVGGPLKQIFSFYFFLLAFHVVNPIHGCHT